MANKYMLIFHTQDTLILIYILVKTKSLLDPQYCCFSQKCFYKDLLGTFYFLTRFKRCTFNSKFFKICTT